MSALDKIPGGKLVQARIRALNGKIDAKSEGAEALPQAEKELVAKRIKELSEWVSQRCQKGISLHELALVADAIDRITVDTSVNFAQWFEGVEQSFQGPVFEPLGRSILPTDGDPFGRQGGKTSVSKSDEELSDEDVAESRLDALIAVLNKEKLFDAEKKILFDEPKEGCARKLPYFIVAVPKLHKKVLVCEQWGEATFVVDDSVPPEDLGRLKKNALQKKYPGKVISISHFNREQWEKELREAVLSEKDYVQLSSPDEIQATLNHDYFHGPKSVENILADLEIFANGKPLADLTANQMRTKERVKLKNGLVISRQQYLGYAGVRVLPGQFSKVGDVQHGKAAEVFNCLREKAGIAGIQDKKYWESMANIKADFDACAKEAGLLNTNGDPDARLLTNKEAYLETEFTCLSGQTVTLARYLGNAGKQRYGYKKVKDGHASRAQVFARLQTDLQAFQQAQPMAAE